MLFTNLCHMIYTYTKQQSFSHPSEVDDLDEAQLICFIQVIHLRCSTLQSMQL